MKKFNIIFEEKDLNIVLGSLGKQSYEIVFQVIAKIQKQIHEQQNQIDDEGKFIVD